jgi:hypothetical protein
VIVHAKGSTSSGTLRRHLAPTDRRVAGVVARRVIGIVVAGLVLGSCGGGGTDASTSLLTTPKPGGRPASSAPGSVTPFGAPPVAAPTPLRGVASTYYDGAGPAPQVDDQYRPACLLMLPTSLQATPIHPVANARFNIFDEFEVTWMLATGRGKGLTLLVYPPGDPSDREFFGPEATVTTLADATELRTAPQRPRSTLISVPTQNCEYELEAHGPFPSAALETAVRSLRLVFAP